MSARKSAAPSPVKGSPADLERQLAAAHQQLDSMRKLYQRLHAHNDEMEAEFCRLQSVLEQVRHTASHKLFEEARCVRSELNVMREAVQFYTSTWQREFKSQQRMILTALGATTGAPGTGARSDAARRPRSATPTGDPVHRALLQAFGEKVHSAQVIDVPTKKKTKKKKELACAEDEALFSGGVAAPEKKDEEENCGADVGDEITTSENVGTRKLTKEVGRLEDENAQLLQRLLQQEETFTKQLQRLKLSHKESETTLATQVKLLSGVLASRNVNPDLPAAVEIPSPIAHRSSASEQEAVRAATRKLLVAHKKHVDAAKSQPAMPELATAARAAERTLQQTHQSSTTGSQKDAARKGSPARVLTDQGLWAERELAHRSSSGTPQRHAFVVR